MYSFGDDASRLGEYTWYYKNAFLVKAKYAHRVGQKKVNAFGLYDMHGNVYEWCSDCYGADYYDNSPTTDPNGPSSGSSRVWRGGSWRGSAEISRSAYRGGNNSGYRGSNSGFRVVREFD